MVFFGGFLGVLYASHPGIWYNEDDIVMHDDPGTSVLPPGVYVDELIIAEGPVTVRAGETLTLINCTLTFLPSPGWEYGLWVGEGGRLEMYDSVVTCNDHLTGYSFEIHGSALIEDSYVEATSDRDEWNDLDSGIEIYNDSVVIRNTTVRNSNAAGVLVYHSSPVIENCTFDGTVRSAIVVSKGEPLVVDCLFTDCLRGVWLWDSDAEVRNCTFQRNRYGIHSEWGSPTIEDCTFLNTNNTAIDVDTNGEAILSNNAFDGNGDDVDKKDMALFKVCP